MDTTFANGFWMIGSGLLIVRVVLGLLMVAHGGQKLFGWLGGYGIRATGEMFEQLGFHPGRLFATAVSLGEMTGGLLLTLGFLGPVGPALMISVMLVAAMSVHWSNGLFAASNGVEVPLLYATAALGFALVGPGPWSLDSALGLSEVWTPAITLAVLAVAVLGGVANLALRRRVQATSA